MGKTSPKSPSLTPILIVGVIIVVCVIVLAKACSSGNNSSKDFPATDSLDLSDTMNVGSQQTARSSYLDVLNAAERSAKLKRLKSKFIYEKDEFSDVGFYYHKHWGRSWPRKKALYAYLNTAGFCFLVSNYYEEDWIFHESAKVIVDTAKYQTETVETYSDLHKTEIVSGAVYENVTYTKSPEIIEAIAMHSDKRVKCRLEGRQYYSEFTLSTKDKQAFKDCYELNYLLNNH